MSHGKTSNKTVKFCSCVATLEPHHRPNLGTPGPAPAQNQVIGAEEMTLLQFVKNHRCLIWYVRTAANEQWARFDLKKLFGVPSLEKAELSKFEQESHTYYGGGGGGGWDSSLPIRKPTFKDVGVVLPPTRTWAVDKTSDLV